MIEMVEEILRYNKEFVESKSYEPYIADKYPTKKVAVLSCMDTRLVGLLPAALGFKNGDIKIIKNAGAVIASPFGSVMRSLVIAIYNLGVEEILVIGHHDCGMQALDSADLIEKMKDRGISEDTLRCIECCGLDFKQWMKGFDRSVQETVRSTVDTIQNHLLIPRDVRVYGLLIDPLTGALERL